MSDAKAPDPLPRPFGNYTLLKLLARGGMGEIYLARSAGLADFEKYYAVKKLLAKFVKDPDVTTRFVDEAKLGARLGHPNIVQVYDLGRIQDELYMAAEFVDGFDLRRILRFCHEKNKRIALDIALFVVREVLSGLAYAHRQVDANGKPIELVHRDISPQNVLVSFEGEVKIIDFGLAKSTQRSTETQANVLLGNFGYMSPEQARGKKLDVRTDVYSTGVVLFELVTGTKRFVDDNPLSLLEKVANPTPLLPSERVPGIPREVDQLYVRATQPKREDRFTDAAQFRDEISAVLYKINPRASREHLAEFLNYLFLGGKPPREPDRDIGSMQNSISLRLGDLVSGSVAFTSGKDDAERRVADPTEKEPVTQTHAMMKSARLGDKVSLAELFKGAAPAAAAMTAPTMTAMPAARVVVAPPPPPAPKPVPVPVPPPSVLSDSALTPVREDAGMDTDSQPPPVVHSDVTVRVQIPLAPPSTPAAQSARAATQPPKAVPKPAFGAPPSQSARPPSQPPPPARQPPPPAQPAPGIGSQSGARPLPPAIRQEARASVEVDETIALDEVVPPKVEVPITRWSVSGNARAPAPAAAPPPAAAPASNPFQAGVTHAESLIIEFDEAEPGRPPAALAPPPLPPPPPIQSAPPPLPPVSQAPPPLPSTPPAAAGGPSISLSGFGRQSPRPPPLASGGSSGARPLPPALVTDEGPPAPLPVRPAMQPGPNARPAGVPAPANKFPIPPVRPPNPGRKDGG